MLFLVELQIGWGTIEENGLIIGKVQGVKLKAFCKALYGFGIVTCREGISAVLFDFLKLLDAFPSTLEFDIIGILVQGLPDVLLSFVHIGVID